MSSAEHFVQCNAVGPTLFYAAAVVCVFTTVSQWPGVRLNTIYNLDVFKSCLKSGADRTKQVDVPNDVTFRPIMSTEWAMTNGATLPKTRTSKAGLRLMVETKVSNAVHRTLFPSASTHELQRIGFMLISATSLFAVICARAMAMAAMSAEKQGAVDYEDKFTVDVQQKNLPTEDRNAINQRLQTQRVPQHAANGIGLNLLSPLSLPRQQIRPPLVECKVIAAFSAGGEVEPGPEAFIDSPFSAAKVASTMVLWTVVLALVGVLILPIICALFGIPLLQLDPVGKAQYFVVLQALETISTFALFSWSLGPYQPLPPGWFAYNRREIFGRRGWLTWAAIGLLLAPFALVAGSIFNDLVGQSGVSATVAEVAALVEKSGTNSQLVLLLMSSIASVLAPLMEEGVFRGFLLPSLTKWFPVPWAVMLSSACFAAAHLSVHDFMPLFLLGNVLGLTYVQTKDLLAPTLVHCFWNLSVLAIVAMSVAAA